MAGKSSRSYIPLYPVPPFPPNEQVQEEDSIFYFPEIKIAKTPPLSPTSSPKKQKYKYQKGGKAPRRQHKPIVCNDENTLPKKTKSQVARELGSDEAHDFDRPEGSKKVKVIDYSFTN